MTSLWRVEMLGGLRVRRGEQVLTRFRTQKTAGLLAYLAFYRERAHPRDVLCDLLWPEEEVKNARHNLSVALDSLRKQLEPPGIGKGAVVRADRYTLQFSPDAITTDVALFEEDVQASGKSIGKREQAERLTAALDRYAGALLPGYYDAWILPQQLRLQDEYTQALTSLAERLIESGDIARALRYAQRAVDADPTCEEFHLTLMRLHLAAGKPAAALRQYSRLEQALQEHFGETPSRAAYELAEQVRRQSLCTPAAAPQSASRLLTPNAIRYAEPERQPYSDGLPTGTVTFLFTGIEGSTLTEQSEGEGFRETQETYQRLLRDQFHQCAGVEIKAAGNEFLAAFRKAGDALACAMSAQKALAAASWSSVGQAVTTRMALDTADVEVGANGYDEHALDRGSHLLSAAHGGQILCSETTASVLRRDLAAGVTLTDLGRYRLRDVSEPERVWVADYPDTARREFPPPRAAPAHAGTLPLPLTRFFGRKQEIEQISIRLANTRLLTLLGPGGTGKTRLSIELGRRLAERYRDAVWFVPLADVSDAGLILSTIQEAMKLPRTGESETLEAVVQALSAQPSLLILDNFEQLVNSGTDVVQNLLERTPALTCLLTSRQRLNLAGECEFAVLPLHTPTGQESLEALSQFESVRLFVDRAQAARSDFQVTRSNARATAELCARLEGIPLALELAAARAKVMSPAQMLGQLAHRLDFFTNRQREVVQRHRTLRAAIDWSYDLLDPELQSFFVRLSVFRGGWTAESAEAVCDEAASLEYLSELRDRSLLSVEDSGNAVRFRMLETLREYGQERLMEAGNAERMRERHGTFFLALAEEAEPHFKGTEQVVWLNRLEIEHDNLRAALDGFASGPHGEERRLRMAGSLNPFWRIRGYTYEGRKRLTEALAQRSPIVLTLARAKSLLGAGALAWDQCEYETARSYFADALEIYRSLDDRQGIANALNNLGVIMNTRGAFEQALACHEESLAVRRELGNPYYIAGSINNLANVHYLLRDFVKARALSEEGLALARIQGEKIRIANCLVNLSMAENRLGEHELSRTHMEESLALYREVGARRGIASSLIDMGIMALEKGDSVQAHTCLKDSLILSHESGNRWEIASALTGFAKLAIAVEQPVRAARLFGGAIGLRESLKAVDSANDRAENQAVTDRLRHAMGEGNYSRAFEEGRSLPMDQVVEEALKAEYR